MRFPCWRWLRTPAAVVVSVALALLADNTLAWRFL
jgi:hypothetical protein